MMASFNGAYQIYNATNAENPVGSGELRILYEDWYKEQGLNYTYITFDGRSDYAGFLDAGIPSGGIATGAEGIKTEEELIAHSVAVYAKSFDGFPKRTPEIQTRSLEQKKSKPLFRYKGNDLVM
ncbi:MAG: Uncharacterized protein AUREO_062570 [Aureobasidium pullulans]|nr:MAG: Uncharacterized protein AUREO_062570 [Aureobasidium pullulans]